MQTSKFSLHLNNLFFCSYDFYIVTYEIPTHSGRLDSNCTIQVSQTFIPLLSYFSLVVFINSEFYFQRLLYAHKIHTLYIYDREGGLVFNSLKVYFTFVDMIPWCITVGTKPPNSNSVMRMPFMCTSEGVSFSHSCF